MWVQVCAGVCRCVHATARVGRTAFGVSPYLSPCLRLNGSSSMLNIPGLLAFEFPPLPAILSDGSVYRWGFYIQLFLCRYLGFEPRSSCLYSKHFTHWAIFPTFFFSVLETKLILNVAETILSIVGALSNHLLWTQASLAGHGR